LQKNFTSLCEKIVQHQHVNIWTLSSNKAEFDRFKGLLDGSLLNSLQAASLNEVLLQQGKAVVAGKQSLVIVHDICDIRKKYSQSMEELSKVRDLDGNWIKGYRSFDSIAIDADKKQLQLLACQVGKAATDLNEQGLEQIVSLHKGLKEANVNVVLCHILDRWFDDINYFETLAALPDSRFVIRIKNWRNSDVEGYAAGAEDENRRLKWGQKTLADSFTRVYEKFAWGEKVHHQVKAHFSYEPIILRAKQYYLLKVELTTRTGESIFKQPMLLLSNYGITGEEMALWVFHRYLKRSKMDGNLMRFEGVFKFLKQHLGWEDFQVRDFTSIENIIVLAYFIGGYFYEIESALTHDPAMKQICLLGYGKGKVTKLYFLRGLAKLAAWEEMQSLVDQKQLTREQINELLSYYKT
jgi:hypothetical protein